MKLTIKQLLTNIYEDEKVPKQTLKQILYNILKIVKEGVQNE